MYIKLSEVTYVSYMLDNICGSIILKWDQPDLNRRPPAPEAGIIPS